MNKTPQIPASGENQNTPGRENGKRRGREGEEKGKRRGRKGGTRKPSVPGRSRRDRAEGCPKQRKRE